MCHVSMHSYPVPGIFWVWRNSSKGRADKIFALKFLIIIIIVIIILLFLL